VQENDTFSEHPVPFVLDRRLKLMQRFTHNSITIYTTQSTMNLGSALSFRMKKTNHSTYLTAGVSSIDCVHVSSAITSTLRSENA
jgi:hypothetical protein